MYRFDHFALLGGRLLKSTCRVVLHVETNNSRYEADVEDDLSVLVNAPNNTLEASLVLLEELVRLERSRVHTRAQALQVSVIPELTTTLHGAASHEVVKNLLVTINHVVEEVEQEECELKDWWECYKGHEAENAVYCDKACVYW